MSTVHPALDIRFEILLLLSSVALNATCWHRANGVGAHLCGDEARFLTPSTATGRED